MPPGGGDVHGSFPSGRRRAPQAGLLLNGRVQADAAW
jgi:hypothetical protein